MSEQKNESPRLRWDVDQPTESLRIVKVSIPAESVRSVLESRIKHHQKKLGLPGFRRGKVPASIIRQRWLETLLHEVEAQLIEANTPTVMNHESFDRKTLVDEGVIKNVK